MQAVPPLTFVLHPVQPFRLDLTAWALRRRTGNLIDRWDGRAYMRTIVVGDRAVDLEVTAAGSGLRVVARANDPAIRTAATELLRRALGLQIDLADFYRMARGDARLARLVDRFRGLKPPRFPTVFEAVVNGIACQQLSLTVGIMLLDRLSTLCGLRSPSGAYAFPRPRDVAALRPAQLRALGFSGAKVEALLGVARAAEAGLDLEALADLDDAAAVERLVELRGIGRLTTFPGDDVGARTNLMRWMKLRRPLDYDRVRRLARRWEPYAGFLYFHLLLQALDEAGVLGAAIGNPE
jgi:DNA-3-methyladenine glycosylase II